MMPHPQTAAESEWRAVWDGVHNHAIHEAHLINRGLRVLNHLERPQQERDVDKIERSAMCGPGQILQVILQQGLYSIPHEAKPHPRPKPYEGN
jgi:hypothetical protein